jgi:hypothetical protein
MDVSSRQSLYDTPQNFDGMVIVLGEMVSNTRFAGVDVRAT